MSSRDPETGRQVPLELDTANTARQLRHINLIADDDSSYIIPIPDGMTPQQFRNKFDAIGVKRFKEADVYADESEIPWIQQLLSTVQIEKQSDWEVKNVGPITYSGAEIKITVNSRYFRALAKIAFHYFLVKNPQFRGDEACFSSIRNFIMSECSLEECNQFVSISREQISVHLQQGHGLKNWGHLLTAQADYMTLSAKVQLFAGPEFIPPVYMIRLGANLSRIDYSQASADFFAYYPEEERGEFDGEVSPMRRLR